MSSGEPQRKPFRWQGVRYASVTAFATRWGLAPQTVTWRLKQGITDERLIARRLRNRSTITPLYRPSQETCAFRKPLHAHESPFFTGRSLAPDASGRPSQAPITGK